MGRSDTQHRFRGSILVVLPAEFAFLMPFLLVLALSPGRLLAQTATTADADAITFEEFSGLVARQHPQQAIDIRSLEQASLAEQRSGVLSDPQLALSRDRLPLAGTARDRDSMAGADDMDQTTSADRPTWTLTLSQSFPWPGTLSAERRAASLDKAGAGIVARRAELERRFAAQELFLAMVRTSELLKVQRQSLAEAQQISRFSQARFRQGIGSHMEYLQSHSEIATLTANAEALAADLANLEAEARLWMGSAPGQTASAQTGASRPFRLVWPDLPVSAGPTPGPDAPDLTRAWLETARDRELASQDAAYRRTLPTITASGMLMQRDGDSMRMYGAMAGVTIPVFSGRTRDSLRAGETLVSQRTSEELAWYDKRRNLLQQQNTRRLAGIQTGLDTLKKTLIPQTSAHLDAALVEYSQGRLSLRDIMDNRRTLLNLESRLVLMREALALAIIDSQKIASGLLNTVSNTPVPQISPAEMPAMQAGMQPDSMPARQATSAVAPDSGSATSPGQNGPGGRRGSPADALTPEDENAKPAGAMPGMGM